MGKGFIGPVKQGWTLADFLSLNRPVEKRDAFMETEPLHVYTMKMDDQSAISLFVWADNDDAFEVSTSSPGFVTKEGARVGDTLATLRKIYPKGQFSKGSEEGPWMSFRPYGPVSVRKDNLSFEFDTHSISYECLANDRGCPDFSEMKSQSAEIHWW